LKHFLESQGIKVGSVIRVPLTTGASAAGHVRNLERGSHAYTPEDVGFLQLLARSVALAIDDALNVGKSKAAQLELERQNARLSCSSDLTNRITSNLDLSEALRAITGASGK